MKVPFALLLIFSLICSCSSNPTIEQNTVPHYFKVDSASIKKNATFKIGKQFKVDKTHEGGVNKGLQLFNDSTSIR